MFLFIIELKIFNVKNIFKVHFKCKETCKNMAILSKLVSGLASVVTSKALYVAGIIVVALAKPACEYTVKLILRDTSAALTNTESSIENKLVKTENAIKKTLAENQKTIQEYILDKINDVNQFTMNEIEGMNAQVSILMNMMKEIKTNQSIILNAISKKNFNDDIVNLNMQLPDKDYIESTILNAINKKNFNDDIVNKLAEMNEKLPDKDYIESTTKKYAMFLHDEHVEIMNINRDDDDTISIASTRAESVPDKEKEKVPRLGPIKFAPPKEKVHLQQLTFAPPPLSGIPKLRKPLSARSVN